MSELATKADLDRVERKLDLIIEYFQIGEVRRCTLVGLHRIAAAAVVVLKNKHKQAKGRNDRGTDRQG